MNDPSTRELLAAQPFCIFCGGTTPAVSKEHCPPRALFDGGHAPEGFVFSACKRCNHGTSDEDLVAAFMGRIDPTAIDVSQETRGLIHAVIKQTPGVLAASRYSPTDARKAARKLGIRPKPGELYRDLPLLRVVPEMERAVESLAAKLTKAMYFKQAGKVFPADGGILLHWFTNEELYSRGKVAVLEVLENQPGIHVKLIRNGKDLADQLGIMVYPVNDADILMVRAAFGKGWGFVSFAFAQPGKAQEAHDTAAAASANGGSHFRVM